MATRTTNYNLAKPEMTDLVTPAQFNENFDILDDLTMPKSGGTFTGMVTLKGDPTANLHPATKQYVDNKSASLVGYSTTEKSTGLTWIDGKTIYRRVYSISNGATTALSFTNANISTLINATIFAYESTSKAFLLNNAMGASMDFNYSTGVFTCWSDKVNGKSCVIIAEYTKK